jgi:hypothetical protein
MKGTLLLRAEQIYSLSLLPFEGTDTNITHDTPIPRATTRAVWSKSGSNEGHITLAAETVFRPYLAPHCSGVTQTSYVALPSHASQEVKVRLKLSSNDGHFRFEAEKFFVPILSPIAAG